MLAMTCIVSNETFSEDGATAAIHGLDRASNARHFPFGHAAVHSHHDIGVRDPRTCPYKLKPKHATFPDVSSTHVWL